MKKALLLLAAIGALAWSLLGYAWAAGPSRVVYSWPSNVGPLNGHDYAPNQMFAQAMVFQGLVKWDPSGVPQPELAQSWEISPDGRVYTFHLRPGVRFSNGEAFDAAAAALNFDAIMAHSGSHSWLGLTSQLESWQALDERTFQITLKAPYYPTLTELSLIRPFRFMAPASIPEDKDTGRGLATQWGIGTGPWALAQSRRGQWDLFEVNPYYWGPKPKIGQVLVQVIPDATSRAMAFEAGQIDLIFGAADGQISVDSFRRFQSQDGVVTSIWGPVATRVVALNSGRFPTDDRSVRQAILQAVDRRALVERVFGGLEKPAGRLFAPSAPYGGLDLEPYDYDPQGAGQLLDQAGWTLAPGQVFRQKGGRRLALELCYLANDGLQRAAAEVIQGDLRKIGLEVTLAPQEANGLYDRQRSGDFGMIFSSTWGAPYDPLLFCGSMRAVAHADYQAQRGLESKAELDEKISQALTSADEGQRRELIHWVLRELHRQAVYLPLSYSSAVAVHRPGLRGLTFGPLMDQIPFEALYWQEEGF